MIALILAPSLSLPFWIISAQAPWFSWAKVYSVVFAAVIVCLLKFSSERYHPLLRVLCVAVLALNIFEALAYEITETYGWINPLAGLLLLLAIPGSRAISFGPGNKFVKYKMPWSLIVGYSIWDMTYIYTVTQGDSAIFGAIHLGLALLFTWRYKDIYFEVRVFTLSVIMILRMYSDNLSFYELAKIPYNENISFGMALISLGFGIYAIFDRSLSLRRYWISSRRREDRCIGAAKLPAQGE
nr:DUF5692 family protein [Roseibium sp. RKSG952]